MRQSAVGFYSKRLELEGVVSSPTDGGAGSGPAITVCHSHPMLGGNMNDPVVTTVCQTASRGGFVTLRFNFRGVGESQGEFSNGKEEHNDIKAALGLLRNWPSVNRKRIGIVGYSTGATIMLDGYRHLGRASAVVLIAPTLAALRGRRFRRDRRPRLVVTGSEDRVAPSLEIQAILDETNGPVRFHEIQGADHSMQAHLGTVGEVVTDFLLRNM